MQKITDNYERDDWVDMPIRGSDGKDVMGLMTREHRLSYTVEDLELRVFEPLHHVNALPFVDVDAGCLLCQHVTVGRQGKGIRDAADADELVQLNKDLVHLLRYTFIECSRPWNRFSNVIDHYKGKPIFKHVQKQFFEAMDFASILLPPIVK